MTGLSWIRPTLCLAAAWLLAVAASAMPPPGAAEPAAASATVPAPAPELEPKAIALLRGMSERLASAKSMSFTAITTYEQPSRIGPALAYSTVSEVTMQRPDKLRVITSGDAPASEFYYDGKTITAFAPAENLVAVANAPPNMDAMFELVYNSAAIYFPFNDLLAPDPFKTIADHLTAAFVIGESKVIGGTITDVVGIASDSMFVQIWIGAEDKLPRMMRAVFRGDPLRLRHQLALSDWKLDPVIAGGAFASADAAKATPIAFAAPQPPALAVAKKAPVKAKAAAAASAPK